MSDATDVENGTTPPCLPKESWKAAETDPDVDLGIDSHFLEERAYSLEKLNTRASVKEGMFAQCDAEKMKQQVRDYLKRPEYNVSMYYWEKGRFRDIATHHLFEYTTLSIISLNALWIAIDTDNNDATTPIDADPIFMFADNFFCIYFSFEWFVRYMAFKKKKNCFKDAWFVFDSVLVFLMVMETWVLAVFLLIQGGGANPLGNASILRLLRLLRLSRLTKLLKSMPELLILIKGMVSAMRSVFFTMVLLLVLMYVFAIAFTQLTAETEVGDYYFHGITRSMVTLLITGTFLDNLSVTIEDIAGSPNGMGHNEGGNLFFAAMFLMFIALAALMVMNMLIGVLCEVVSNVAQVEKEMMAAESVNEKMKEVMEKLDQNGDNVISKEEFKQILENKAAIRALNEVGVDPVGLVDAADWLFEFDIDDPEHCDALQFDEFMELVLSLRGSNTATVKDICDLTKVVRRELSKLSDKMDRRFQERLQKFSTSSSRLDKTTSARSVKSGLVAGKENGGGGLYAANEAFEDPPTPVIIPDRPRLPHKQVSFSDDLLSSGSETVNVTVFLNTALGELNRLRAKPDLPGQTNAGTIEQENLSLWACEMEKCISEGLEQLRRIQAGQTPQLSQWASRAPARSL